MLSWLVTPRVSSLSLHLLRHLSTRFFPPTANSVALINVFEDPNRDRGGGSSIGELVFKKQSVGRTSADGDSAQRERGPLTVGRKGLWVIAQTDSSTAFADGKNFYHVYKYVDSSEGEVRQLEAAKGLRESGHFCSGNCPFTRIMQAAISCCMQADLCTPIRRLPATQTIPARRFQSRLRRENLTSWRGIHRYPNFAVRDDTQRSRLWSIPGGRSFCDASLFAGKSLDVSSLKARKQSDAEEGDNPLTLENDNNSSKQILEKDMLPLDDFADMLFSAVTHQGEADMYQIRRVLCRRYRRMPTENFMSDLQQKVESIMSQSLPHSVVKTLLKKRCFLFVSYKEFQAVLKLLKNFLGSGEKASVVLARSPSILATPIERIQKMLNLILEFQIEKHACERSGNMLTFDAAKAKNVLTFLADWGVDANFRNVMIYRDARCLGWSVEEHIQPTLDYLESTGMSKPEILQVLRESPDILKRSIAYNLKFKHEVCQKLGLNFGLAIRYTTYHSTERFLSQFEFLRQEGFSESAIVELVQREPRILGKSREDLKVKLDYLLITHNRNIDEIIKFPACLSYSFKCRIMPRLAFLKEKGMLDSFCLNYVLAMKSSNFRRVFKVPDLVKLI